MLLYLNVLLILSWSLLEAMSAGCAIVSSSTPPVLEVLEHERSALLVDFFDEKSLVDALRHLLDQPSLRLELGDQARQRAAFYCHQRGLQAWTQLLMSA